MEPIKLVYHDLMISLENSSPTVVLGLNQKFGYYPMGHYEQRSHVSIIQGFLVDLS